MRHKAKVLVTRPLGWEKLDSEKLDIEYVPLCGARPALKTGRIADSDGHLAAATPGGVDKLVKRMRELRPQILMRWINTKMPRTAWERIRDASPDTIIMCADGNGPSTGSKYFESHRELLDVPLVNTRESRVIRSLRDRFLHADTLYEAFFPELYERGIKARHTCFFAGSNRRRKAGTTDSGRKVWKWDFPNGEFRFRLVTAVAKKYDLRLHAHPKEWPGGMAKRPLRGAEHVRAFQTAHIALCCNHYDLQRYYTRRIFNAGGSGRLVLTKRIPGMRRDFGKDGEHVAVFDEVPEALSMIGWYMRHKKRMAEVAKRGHRLFLRRHTWRARFRDFERIAVKVL